METASLERGFDKSKFGNYHGNKGHFDDRQELATRAEPEVETDGFQPTIMREKKPGNGDRITLDLDIDYNMRLEMANYTTLILAMIKSGVTLGTCCSRFDMYPRRCHNHKSFDTCELIDCAYERIL